MHAAATYKHIKNADWLCQYRFYFELKIRIKKQRRSRDELNSAALEVIKNFN